MVSDWQICLMLMCFEDAWKSMTCSTISGSIVLARPKAQESKRQLAGAHADGAHMTYGCVEKYDKLNQQWKYTQRVEGCTWYFLDLKSAE